ncbi:NAD(P)-dependent oxidoreductase [Paenibacillus roseipurpureus]|uniref:NAD(P)-dependent oxidoreductase n=1 Tax=Paenibacillus roseopurpureus TaxID=2918901 RepID=A0AA96LT25_9BACL|nr:NAD(P)-dependent oxidoreductase [Paenibacillus sp. MBLB1832]WNR46756.1 NAD(P)-dependent oxidoreductase [Paenibacillus sp. MBLB1832]
MSTTFISLTDLKRNFAEVKAGMKPKEAIEESNRCLFCYDAPCTRACPTGIDVPSFIKKIATGNLKGSARTILEANPVGASCSRVCPTEELCEGACVLNQSSKPILIGQLQRYVTDWAIKNEQMLFQAGASNGKSVAVVGSGPAGLSAARELARFGFQVTVFEAKAQAGGLDTFGIVSFRLPQEISLWEVEQVKQLGVTFRLNTRVGVDVSSEELLRNYDAVLLAVGMAKVPMLGIEGENLHGVFDAIDFVEGTKVADNAALDTSLLGKRVAVIGAGNTAIDAATCSVRLGAEAVQIVYRRTQSEMTAYDFEYEFAKGDGVTFRWLTAPKRIIGDEEGCVTGVECLRMELVISDDGRQRPIAIPGSEFVLEVDAVIKAIGQTKHTALIEQFGLVHVKGTVTVDPETGATSHPQVYAAGDVIFGDGQGEAMVVSASQQGKRAAYAIYQQLVKGQEASA